MSPNKQNILSEPTTVQIMTSAVSSSKSLCEFNQSTGVIFKKLSPANIFLEWFLLSSGSRASSIQVGPEYGCYFCTASLLVSVYQIYQFSPFLDSADLALLIQAFVTLQLDYCM